MRVAVFVPPVDTKHKLDQRFYRNELLRATDVETHRAHDVIGRCYIMRPEVSG